MGRTGRDPEFFRYVNGDVADRLMRRTEYALTSLPMAENPYLRYILTGNFASPLPFYLRPENFAPIRDHLGKLALFQGSLQEALRAYGDWRFDGLNLSDIFEYMGEAEYTAELDRIITACNRRARLVYWNMLVERRSPESFRKRLQPLTTLADELFRRDMAFFYQALMIEEVQ
jgi:S-adenosylmethionine-diacylglycerol 3-amino-3-carboxypropyl transferase